MFKWLITGNTTIGVEVEVQVSCPGFQTTPCRSPATSLSLANYGQCRQDLSKYLATHKKPSAVTPPVPSLSSQMGMLTPSICLPQEHAQTFHFFH